MIIEQDSNGVFVLLRAREVFITWYIFQYEERFEIQKNWVKFYGLAFMKYN